MREFKCEYHQDDGSVELYSKDGQKLTRTGNPHTNAEYMSLNEPAVLAAFVESFNGKFRDACLNSHWFVDITDARRSIETWRVHYNTVRPHSSLGFLSPEQSRMAGETGCGKDGRSATLENSTSFPLSHSHDGGDNSPNSSLSTWT